MHEALDNAREFANQVRFSRDTLTQRSRPNVPDLKSIFYTSELCISEDVTPELNKSIQIVLDKFGIPRESVEAFVYASPDINAQCFASHSSECVIRFSSSLINILTEEEFRFVVGHELGHFLLQHANTRGEDDQSVEYFQQQRAQEISADRLGLIASNSLHSGIKALMKTISGLGDDHLRLDVGSFLSQLKKTHGVTASYQSTHPSILVRSKALLWFSLNESFKIQSQNYSKNDLLDLDDRIQRDLDKYVDSSVRAVIEEAKFNFGMWLAAYEIVEDGLFTKDEQAKFSDLYGEDKLEKLINFLKGSSTSEIKGRVKEKMDQAKEELAALIPDSYEDEIAKMQKWDV